MQGSALASAARLPVLHVANDVRRTQEVTQRTLARHVGVNIPAVRALLDPHYDLRLSELYAIAEALDVPAAELLADPGPVSDSPLEKRAAMIKAMKWAAAIAQQCPHPGTRIMANQLVDELLGIMPELATVSPWQSTGIRRSTDELGRAAVAPINTTRLPMIAQMMANE